MNIFEARGSVCVPPDIHKLVAALSSDIFILQVSPIDGSELSV